MTLDSLMMHGLATTTQSPASAGSVLFCQSRFTGKERDTETGLDYFGARYYASNMGRFMSADWSATPQAVPYGHFENPQSLNLYGYVLNNPVTDIDGDGHVMYSSHSDGHEGGAPVLCGDDPTLCFQVTEAVQAAAADNAAQQTSAEQSLRSAMFPVVEDFSQIGSTDANFNHVNYSVTSGAITQYTEVDGDLPTVKTLGSGYSGKGDGVNNPKMEDVPGAPGKPVAGPIPEGKYTIGKEQANKLGNGKVLSNSMRLTPDAGNKMYGRGGFLMHGGSWNLTSSEGCIVVPDVNVRNAVGSSGTNVLTVTQ